MGYKTAEERRAYMKERRLKLKSLGVCVDCSKRPAEPESVLCTKCKVYRHRSRVEQRRRHRSISPMTSGEKSARIARMLELAERCA